jgi:hypothetical protein
MISLPLMGCAGRGVLKKTTYAPSSFQHGNGHASQAFPNMGDLSSELVLVPDEELERLAEDKGPTSAEAQVLAQLTTQARRTCRSMPSGPAINTSPDLYRRPPSQPTPRTNSLRY